ncbi:pentatricopeptide repeat-containing protein At3g53360, mitochondrial [Impatiens glandulifera]|uniref:pentatricopeptide repeat-containing protein At3g53360, mitochondrial n=1 Tax=Impatiens glandulifera TaxID=253017 RepID=UPI001FB16D40|nr:pentatricopeptide repeat-containing protein At3g53360, mitochondrial [Impatiens glandulifera]
MHNILPRLRFAVDTVRSKVPVTLTCSNFKTEQSSNDYISSFCNRNQFREALEAFDLLCKNTNFHVKPSTYARLLSACSSLGSLKLGRDVHNHMLTYGCQPDIIIGNRLVTMYGKCGSMEDARKVFDEMPERNQVSWASIIAGYSQHGHGTDALQLFVEMRKLGLMPDQFIFGSIIRACSSLVDIILGKQLHAQIIKSQAGYELISQNALLAMYSKLGLIDDAWNLFSSIASKDLISWSSIISGLWQTGYELEAMLCFKEMLSQCAYQPNEFVFGSVFSACGRLLEQDYGRQIQVVSIKYGFGRDNYVICSLADMYAKCGLLHSAKLAFSQIERPDLVSWNTIIIGFACGGEIDEAMSFFSKMRELALFPDGITIRSLLCACTNHDSFHRGMQIHSFVIKTGLNLEISVSNTIISMYSRCYDLLSTFKIFDETKTNRDLVSWNTILSACVKHNEAREVFSLLRQMFLSNSKPDNITLTSVLGACGQLASIEMGEWVHGYCVKSGLDLNICVINGLIDMHMKCGSLMNAEKLFNSIVNCDVVSWSTMIIGYAQLGLGEQALTSFRKMCGLGLVPNEVAVVGVLTACSHMRLVELGMQIYNSMEVEHGLKPTREHCSCVVDLLARAGCINEAEDFMNKMEFEPDIVMWKTLLAACRIDNNVDVAKRAAENILKIDPLNSSAHVLLCNICASTERWEDVAKIRILMKKRRIRKVPGQSWIEVKNCIHRFLSEDNSHPEGDRLRTVLQDLWQPMLDDGYAPMHKTGLISER